MLLTALNSAEFSAGMEHRTILLAIKRLFKVKIFLASMGIAEFLKRTYTDVIILVIFSLFLFINYYSFNPLKYIGILISISGFVIWILGKIYLGDAFQIKAEAKKLITSGIYSRIRNPIYFGGFLVILGWLIYTVNTEWTSSLVIVIIFYGVVQILRVLKEEKILTRKFGKRYTQYKSQTWF